MKVNAPPGWKLVPIQPTQGMLQAAWAAHPNNMADYFTVMVEAAPEYTPPAPCWLCNGTTLIESARLRQHKTPCPICRAELVDAANN